MSEVVCNISSACKSGRFDRHFRGSVVNYINAIVNIAVRDLACEPVDRLLWNEILWNAKQT